MLIGRPLGIASEYCGKYGAGFTVAVIEIFSALGLQI
jgi:hypothetical protein